MTAKPTLWVTNYKRPDLHGPGRKFSIMAKPRQWEQVDGRVFDLTPDARDLWRYRNNQMSLAEYKDACVTRWHFNKHRRGQGLLAAWVVRGGTSIGSVTIFPEIGPDDERIVADGDTLLCACAKDVADADGCHRCWAARLLVDVGWRVILDGKEVAA